ncbi:MAG: excinuclease ABC subunit UvrC [Bacteroidales bacterium]|nr:excinuclease ABC subunit UvrC [Bacteroidales bacterium]
MKQLERFLNLCENLPEKPGVYKFIDINNCVLYVGKAKNLKKRVRSYITNFDKSNTKLKLLVSKTYHIEYIIVKNETDAFLLENNLIKSIKPRYNVLLKDDKTYPWIKITNEEYPRILKTRQYVNDGSKYFGPYPSISLLYTLLELLHKIFNIRTCKLKLNEDSILNNKFKVCLEYHIGNCKGPCVNLISYFDYQQRIQYAEKVLKGNLKDVSEYLTKKMYEHSDKLEFELANEYKQKLELLQNYQSRSVVVNPKLSDLDVFTAKQKENKVFINYLKINHGSVVQSYNLVLQPQLDESFEDLFLFGIFHIRELFHSNSSEIIVPLKFNSSFDNIKFFYPKSGDKLKLLKLSLTNLDTYIHQFTMNQLKANYGNVNTRLLEKVKSDLQLRELPVRIECFDISHIQGKYTVASCVVFVNAKPSKNDYRHYIIKTVTHIDDFSSIYEVVYRRFKRLLEEQKPLPHLIIIDGGKGQLSSALKALNDLNLNIDIISIAKKLEEIYKPGDSFPFFVDKRSETLKLIQRIRNEAHRFAVSFHRNMHLKNSFHSVLDFIPNIGEKTKLKLLQHFQSVDILSSVNIEDLEKIVGRNKAKIIFEFFRFYKSIE